jgi:RNA polymerase sigma factor (sigma-70 family)
MLRTQSDARLVDLVRAGHAAAFEAIVQRYRRPLLAYCSRLLPASRAEDAVQQTFLKAYQAMISGDAELNLRPWLYRIAHNASLNLLRQNGWSHEQLDEKMDGVQRPEEAVELRERLRSTVRAVNELPERQRSAVLLRELEGLSYQEIALALGVGDGAVRQLLHRARATLQAGATAITPTGLVERLTSAMTSGADPVARATELAAGAGVGVGAVKLGAAVLATGVIATGAVTGVPLRHHARHGASPAAEEAAVAPKAAGDSSSSGARSGAPAGALVDRRSGERGRGRSGDRGESRHSHRGRGGGHGRGSSGRSEDRHGSSSGGSGDSPGDHHRRGSGGGSGSGSSDGSGDGGGDRHGGSGSGTSGGSGDAVDGSRSGSGDASSLTLSGGGGSGETTTTSGDDGQTLTAPTGTTDSSGSSGDRTGSDGGESGSTSGG